MEWKCDDLGPQAVIFIHDPLVKLEAFVVIDNNAAGPGIGGVRMSPSVTVGEVARLARAMTFKAAAAGLPHGGAKSGIIANPKGREVEPLIRAFARAIACFEDYIPGPDMGTDERTMALIKDEMGRAAGLPRVLGGIPLDEIGATGQGLAASVEVAQRHAGIDLAGASVAIQGFGNVGLHAAVELAARGAKIVAVSDSRGAVVSSAGLDVAALVAHKRANASVTTFAGGQRRPGDELIATACDILVPAAQPDVITAANVASVQAKLIVCGANIPITEEAEHALHERGIVVVPDFIANAGGLICAATELAGGSEAQALERIRTQVAANTRAVLDEAKGGRARPRIAAERLAERRVREAMSYRRHGVFAPSRGAEMLDM